MLTDTEFREVQRKMMTAWHRGDLGEASAVLDKVLKEGTSDMKGECLFYQGMINEDQGSLSDARQNWLDALQYARDETFLRFQLELNIGETWERETQSKEALDWYRKALNTCCDGDKFVGIKALNAYLRLKAGKVEPADEPLVACVAEKSWRALELSGAPDFKDLAGTAAKLTEALASRAEKIVNESEG